MKLKRMDGDMVNRHEHGVSPRNRSFHEQNGQTIIILVGIILLACFWPIILKVVGCVLTGVFLWFVAEELWRGM